MQAMKFMLFVTPLTPPIPLPPIQLPAVAVCDRLIAPLTARAAKVSPELDVVFVAVTAVGGVALVVPTKAIPKPLMERLWMLTGIEDPVDCRKSRSGSGRRR